eukprot:NODE_4003_length_1130_cov_7.781529_g3810_i0.p1 GENE.NODE_4003_length_1130_cov_7.781529_g3810_i0~~NODE_4003_length_1130_cov_7.781529_g3810_i0.p1  ORF type:complete len:333 (+),score=29.14 NODE_4003_length_1130_cov_7.781529_g3810_i0:72-1070(+)
MRGLVAAINNARRRRQISVPRLITWTIVLTVLVYWVLEANHAGMPWSRQLHNLRVNALCSSADGDYDLPQSRSPHHLAIAGMVKNAASTLAPLLENLGWLACEFASGDILVMENNSNDDTPEKVRQWQLAPAQCRTVRKHLLQPEVDPARGVFGRTNRFAIYRNMQLQWAKDTGATMLLLVDFDITALDIQPILYRASSWLQQQTVTCSHGLYGPGHYRDTFATVLDDGRYIFTETRRGANAILQEGAPRLPVRSCFGGAALYDLGAIRKTTCKYWQETEAMQQYPTMATYLAAMDTPGVHSMCEHIPFHHCLLEHGGNIAIDTDWTVYYGM